MRAKCVGALAVVFAMATGSWAVAQEAGSTAPRPRTAPDRVEQLERTVETLSQQLAEIKKELAQLKAERAAEKQKEELARLRQEASAEAAKPAAATAPEVDTTTRFVSGTRMQPQLNPELSVVGDIFFVGGNHQQEEFQARHFELDLQSYLDPYTKIHVVFGYHAPHYESTFGAPEDDTGFVPSGWGLGEGYVTWLNLPGGLTLTVGKKRQQFGVLNRWHLHALDQTDLPWVLQESFGDHGLSGTGVSIDWLMPHLWSTVNELTVEVMNADNPVAFAGNDWSHPSILARLKNYWDLTSNSYFELGLDGLHGNADRDGHFNHDFWAVDASYNWYPAGKALYRELTFRGMLLRSILDREEGGTLRAWGGYLYGQYKFSPHWIAGLRYDRVFDQQEAGHSYWGFSPYMTFWQSEFVRLRGQFSYRKDDLYGIDRRYELQLTVAAGPHKHDKY